MARRQELLYESVSHDFCLVLCLIESLWGPFNTVSVPLLKRNGCRYVSRAPHFSRLGQLCSQAATYRVEPSLGQVILSDELIIFALFILSIKHLFVGQYHTTGKSGVFWSSCPPESEVVFGTGKRGAA